MDGEEEGGEEETQQLLQLAVYCECGLCLNYWNVLVASVFDQLQFA